MHYVTSKPFQDSQSQFQFSKFHNHVQNIRIKRGTKARLGCSGGPHAPINMADNMEEVNVSGKKMPEVAPYAKFLKYP